MTPTRAFEVTSSALAGRAEVDVVHLARHVPTRVLARPETYEPRSNLRVPVLRPARLTAHRAVDVGADQ